MKKLKDISFKFSKNLTKVNQQITYYGDNNKIFKTCKALN